MLDDSDHNVATSEPAIESYTSIGIQTSDCSSYMYKSIQTQAHPTVKNTQTQIIIEPIIESKGGL